MKRILLAALVGAAAALGAGCADGSAEIKVTRNGSGTISLRLVSPRDAQQRVRQVAELLRRFGFEDTGLMGQLSGGGGDQPFASREGMAAFGRQLGPQVRMTDYRRITQGAADEGIAAEYAFPDIRGVRWRPAADPAQARNASGLAFDFARGTGGCLLKVIPLVHAKRRAAAANAPGLLQMPGADTVLENFLSGLRMRLTLRVEGTILRTNAQQKPTASTVTLALLEAARMRSEDFPHLLAVREFDDAVELQRQRTPGIFLQNPAEPLVVLFK